MIEFITPETHTITIELNRFVLSGLRKQYSMHCNNKDIDPTLEDFLRFVELKITDDLNWVYLYGE